MIIEGGITQRCCKEERDRMRHVEGTEGGSREIEGICWLDKSILQTRPISLVSEDSLATNGQTNLSFSRHMRFISKYYKGVKILP